MLNQNKEAKIMKKWIAWIFMICMMGVYSFAAFGNSKTVFIEDFKDSAAAMKNLNLYPGRWEVADGILRSKNSINDDIAIFSFGDVNWKDYDVEFKIKRLEANSKDQHFSIYVRCDKDLSGTIQEANNMSSGLRLYCRGDAVSYIEIIGKKTARSAEAIGTLSKRMEVGGKSPWSTFKVAVKGNTAAVYVDGSSICKIDNIVPSSGKLAFFVYNVKVAITDLKVTVYSTVDQTR